MDNQMDKKNFDEEMISIGDIRMFLKSSPHESGERTPLDKILTIDQYYKDLYAHSRSADDLIDEIKRMISYEDTHNFILSGYKGCGKSTFVGYLLRNIKARNLTISFDHYWEPDVGISQNIAMFLCRKILDDILPKNEKSKCRVAEKYLELYRTGDNANYIDRHIDLNNYFRYFGDKLYFAVLKSKEGFPGTRKYIDDDIKPHIASGTIASMMTMLVFWDIADRIVNDKERQCFIVFENLDVIYNTQDVPQLVQNVVAFRNNVDRISESLLYNGQSLSDPTQDYVLIFVMRETTKAEFSSCIDHFSDRKIRFYTFRDMSNVYNLYDIVNKRFAFLKGLEREKPYYATIPAFSKLKKSLRNILILLADPVVWKNFYGIFDNDYRTCIEALSSMSIDDDQIINTYNSLLEISANTPSEGLNENWPTFASRCIIFRDLFNLFVREGYSAALRKSEYTVNDEEKLRGINLGRMILLYLSNSIDPLDVGAQEPDYVSLDTLYKELLKFCTKPDAIVDALWEMFDLRKEQKWNHLVTFDDMKQITYNQLKIEMTAVLESSADALFSKVKITLAGQKYLNFILPHFEYYSARSQRGKGYSLFMSSPEQLCEIDKICKLLISEIKEITGCCTRLYNFFVDIMDSIDEFKGKQFLDTKFAVKKYSEYRQNVTRMYHCEKIVYSSIGYLDSFRLFVFYSFDQVLQRGKFNRDVDIIKFLRLIPSINKNLKNALPSKLFDSSIKSAILVIPENDSTECKVRLLNDEGAVSLIDVQLPQIIEAIKVCFNKRIIDHILLLIHMFGFQSTRQCVLCSEGTPKICVAFDACIKAISRSNYSNFELKINTSTGEKLCRIYKKREKQKRHEVRREQSLAKKYLLGTQDEKDLAKSSAEEGGGKV